MSSRLFLSLRERLGLAYSVESFVSSLKDTGSFGVYAGVHPARLEEALRAILKEWADLCHAPVPAEELNKAREYVKGQTLLQLEDTFTVASWYGRQELLGPDVLTVDEALAKLDQVTAEDIHRLAAQLLNAQNVWLAVVGPLSEPPDMNRLLGG